MALRQAGLSSGIELAGHTGQGEHGAESRFRVTFVAYGREVCFAVTDDGEAVWHLPTAKPTFKTKQGPALANHWSLGDPSPWRRAFV